MTLGDRRKLGVRNLIVALRVLDAIGAKADNKSSK
jgi:hypothetical protein